MNRLATFVILAVIAPIVCVGQNADWPQWRGVNRDAHAAPQELLQQWPDSGPKLAWKCNDLGSGYSASSVVGDQVFTMGTKDGRAVVICLSLKDGSTLWETPVGRAGTGDDYNAGWGAGQRSTPTVNGNQVFALSDVGVLAALDKAGGDIQWKVDLVNDYGGKIPKWGYSESPLIDGNRVVITAGKENFMIALDRNSGQLVWNSVGIDSIAHYVSIIKANFYGTPVYVTASEPGLILIHAETGKPIYQDSATGNEVAVIPTPIVSNNYIYHSAAYSSGNTLLAVKPVGSEIEFESVYALRTKTMENHHGGLVLVDGVIYGFTKQGGGAWMAQDLESGETLWMERRRPNKSGSICYADGRLYCYNDKDGTVLLVNPSREGFDLQGELTIPAETDLPRASGAIWAHPIVANGKLIIRDQDLMYAFDIAR